MHTSHARNDARALAAAIIALALIACTDTPTDAPVSPVPAGQRTSAHAAGRYLVTFTASLTPSRLTEEISALGGAVIAAHEAAGLAVVTGLGDDGAAALSSLSGISTVNLDPVFTPNRLEEVHEPGEVGPDATHVAIQSHALPSAAMFYARQWNMRAIHANAAWEAGYFGSPDVTVALLDTGIDYSNPDLAGHVDLSRSVSFVPEEDAFLQTLYPGRHPISDLRGHGTSVAGHIVSNGHILAGVTREVTLFGVKVHNRFREGVLSDYLRGILYAVDHGADVINMSIGGQLVSPFSGGNMDKSAFPGLVAAVERAVNYAFRKGVVVVASAGNDGVDLDHDGNNFRVFCNAVHVICVAATAPARGAGVNGPWVDPDAQATTTNYGRSAVSVAAPGGNPPAQRPFTGVWNLCTTTPTSTSPGVCQAGAPVTQIMGTSWSAGHASGLAALLVEMIGKGRPAQIRAAIEQSADDLGEPGTDPIYGKGRINVARALGLQ